MPLITKLVAASALAAAATALATPASAGEWRLDPRRCANLVEDRMDRRMTTSRRDLREDLRDARRVNCAPNAWVYVPSRWERMRFRGNAKARAKAPPPSAAVIYVRPDGRYVWRRGPQDYLNVRLIAY